MDRQRLVDFARRLLGSSEDAEDAVQDTYVRALSNSTPAQGEAPWLHTVLRNVAIDGLRRRRLEKTLAESPPADPILDAPDLESDCEAALHHLLARVSALEAAVMLLRDIFEFDYDEIAPIVGKSEAAIRQLLHRARLSSRCAESGEVDEYQVALCWQAIATRDPEPLLGLLPRTCAGAQASVMSPTAFSSRSSTQLLQINGRYALALILNGAVLCVVPVGTCGTLRESTRAD